ncbi:MAG: PAS domain S-box protein, partial [Candidatus Micrarchaeota archaeon]
MQETVAKAPSEGTSISDQVLKTFVALISDESASALLGTTYRELNGVLEFELLGLARPRGSEEAEILEVSGGDNEKISEKKIPLVGSLIGEAMVSGKGTRENRMGKYSAHFDVRGFFEKDYKTMLAIPLKPEIRDRHPVLYFLSKGEEAFAGEKARYLELLAEQVGRSLHNLTLAEKTGVSQVLLQNVFEESGEAIFVLAKDGKILEANKKAGALLGRSREELGNMEIQDLLPDRDEGVRLFEQILGGKISEPFIYEYLKKDGKRTALKLNASSLEINGERVIKLTGIEIPLAEINGEHALEVVSALAFVSDASGRIVSVSEEVKKSLGYGEEELHSKELTALIHHEDMRAVDEIFQKAHEGVCTPKELEIRFITKSGEVKFFELCGRGVYNATGKLLKMDLIAREVGERRRIAEREQMLDKFLADSAEAVYSFDKFGLVRFWNESAERMFSYRKEEIVGREIGIIYPSDRRRELDEVIIRLNKDGKMSRFDTLRQKKTGEKIHVAISPSVLRNKDGSITGYIEIASDM